MKRSTILALFIAAMVLLSLFLYCWVVCCSVEDKEETEEELPDPEGIGLNWIKKKTQKEEEETTLRHRLGKEAFTLMEYVLYGNPYISFYRVMNVSKCLLIYKPSLSDQTMAAIIDFAQKFNGTVRSIDTTKPAEVKALIMKEVEADPVIRVIILIGGPSEIPMYTIGGSQGTFDTDYYYGDLDNDGILDHIVTRMMFGEVIIQKLLTVPQPEYVLNNVTAVHMSDYIWNQSSMESTGFACSLMNSENYTELSNKNFLFFHAGHGDNDVWNRMDGERIINTDNIPDSLILDYGIGIGCPCFTGSVESRILPKLFNQGLTAFIGATTTVLGYEGDPAYDIRKVFWDAITDRIQNSRSTIGECYLEWNAKFIEERLTDQTKVLEIIVAAETSGTI